jgi:uncharacterized membrane protein YuzA (DUF378 family)
MMFDNYAFTDPLYLSKFAHKIAIVLLIVGGLNWLIVGVFGVDMVRAALGRGILSTAVYIAVGLSALALMFHRDTYLPFLGESIAPCASLQDRVPPGATREVRVSVPAGSKVLYWASEPASAGLETVNSWKEAYGQYENAGIATADGNGVALLRVRDPQPYAVPWKGKIDSHVHFRICQANGFMSRVKTVFVGDNHVEGFVCPMQGY